MRNNPVVRPVTTLAALLLLAVGMSGCGADEPDVGVGESTKAETDASEQPDAVDESAEPAAKGDGDYVFGLEKDNMVEVIEKTYQSRNAKARWEGEVFVVALDGDGQKDFAGFSDCRVLTQILNEGDEVTVEYPNGKIDCAEALADDD